MTKFLIFTTSPFCMQQVRLPVMDILQVCVCVCVCACVRACVCVSVFVCVLTGNWLVYFYTGDQLNERCDLQNACAPNIYIHGPRRPGNSGTFNFSKFKALVKVQPCGAKFLVKTLLKAPALWGLTIMRNDK